MPTTIKTNRPLEDPLAEIERQLISAYLAGAGQDLETLLVRNDDAAKKLRTEASLYASSKLSEIEARLHYLRSLQGHL